MNLLLQLKHWQIFLLLVLPLMFQDNHTTGQVITIVWTFIWTAWIYSIGTTAHEKISKEYKISKTYFDICFVTIVLYMAVTVIIFDGGYTVTSENMDQFNGYGPLLMIGTFYMMFNLMYMFYFAAKMLRSNVENKLVTFNSSFGYFFGFWFFPIGIWFIQPKAQQLLIDNNDSST
jgi:hypothetical protein